MNLMDFFSSHRAEILQATLAHLFLVVVSMAIAIAIGVPLGMVLINRARLRAMALGFVSILQTIPSLALFGFLIPLPFLVESGHARRLSRSFYMRFCQF